MQYSISTSGHKFTRAISAMERATDHY